MKKTFIHICLSIFVIFLSIRFANAVDCSTELPTSVSVTDINACINSTSSAGGGEVELSSGTFYVDEPIVLKSDVTLRGQGKTSTTIQYNGSSTSDDIISNMGDVVSNVTIRDLTVKGTGDGTGDNQICIVIKDDNGGENTQITIRDSRIEECGQYGIHIKGANGIHITSNTIRHNGTDHELDHNIYLRRVSNAKVELSTSNYAAGNGINVSFSDNVVVRSFKAKYNGQNGIRFAHSEYVEANDVTASRSGYGSKSDSDPCDEAGNDIADDLCNGIELRTEDDCEEDDPADDPCHDTYDGVDYACVRNSTAKNNYSFWLYIQSATNYELSDNDDKSGNRKGGQKCSIDSTDDDLEDDDDKCVSTSSTSASDACDSINPTDWPFDGSTDSDYTATAIAAFEGADDDDDGYDSTDGGGDDCDDTSDTVYPGASETCGDGTDQNCDGADPSCDADGDGITDAADICPSTSPLDASDSVNASGCALSQLDSDGDSLTDYQETITYGTDPAVSDTDGDGLSDGTEVASGSNPLSSDTDGDGVPDGSDLDPLVVLDLTPVLELILSGDEDGDGQDSTDEGGADCNDENASVYSGATEVCGDGIDQDCSGSDTSCDTDGDGVNDVDEIAEGSDPNDATSVACVTPVSETDWTITGFCTLMRSKTWAGDLYIQSGAVVTIPAGISLDMDLSLKKLRVQSGSGVLIEQGGTLH